MIGFVKTVSMKNAFHLEQVHVGHLVQTSRKGIKITPTGKKKTRRVELKNTEFFAYFTPNLTQSL